MKLIYLGQPYSHDYSSVRETRAMGAQYVTGRLMRDSAVFSPIVHGHAVERHVGSLHDAHRFWMTQCIAILRRCDEMYVLPLMGWRGSRGLRDELAICKQLNIPIKFLSFVSIGMRDFASTYELDEPSVEEAAEKGWEFIYV